MLQFRAGVLKRARQWLEAVGSCLQGIVTVGDYDGVVAQVHIPSGHLLADVDEYMGRR